MIILAKVDIYCETKTDQPLNGCNMHLRTLYKQIEEDEQTTLVHRQTF